MGFYDTTVQFNGKRVVNFDPELGIQDTNAAYRFFTDYDTERDVPTLVEQFLADPKAKEIDTLVIGLINVEGDESPSAIINLLIKHQVTMQQLTGIFFGDVTQEECEVSWLENCDHSAMLQAFPHLEIYKVRGGNGLSFTQLQHPNLKKFIIETGGMDNCLLDNLKTAHLPQLEHLELWLGSDNYGFNADAEQVVGAVEAAPLPKLTYLGLRNAEIADDIAKRLEKSPLLEQINILDLSMGNLSDEGAEALLDNPTIKRLSQLILDHHYMSDDMVEQLEDLGIPVSADDPQEEDRYGDEVYRYIAVSE